MGSSEPGLPNFFHSIQFCSGFDEKIRATQKNFVYVCDINVSRSIGNEFLDRHLILCHPPIRVDRIFLSSHILSQAAVNRAREKREDNH